MVRASWEKNISTHTNRQTRLRWDRTQGTSEEAMMLKEKYQEATKRILEEIQAVDLFDPVQAGDLS